MIITDERRLEVPCESVSAEEQHELLSLLEYELAHSKEPGIGLAANQIGILKRAFIIRISDNRKYDFINPEITQLSEPLIFRGEGCLSFPGKAVRTLRYNKLTIIDDLFPQGRLLSGLSAIAAQHEYQHTIGQTMFRNELSNITDDMLCLCSSGLNFGKCCKSTLRKNMRVF